MEYDDLSEKDSEELKKWAEKKDIDLNNKSKLSAKEKEDILDWLVDVKLSPDYFTSLIDDASWEEFMPKGFTKETFNILKDCFDRSIFTGAAKRIRQMVKEADNLNTEDRIAKIATIFSYFHNPDKETVLTPWRVVNMHMSDTVGGWCFWDEDFVAPYTEENKYGENVNAARPVGIEVDDNNQLHFTNEVTKDIFGDYNSRILEINSKTGLYPLYMAYSLFKGAKEPNYRKIHLTGERGKSLNAEQYYHQAGDDLEIWKDVLQDNIFVVCRTKMAVSITKRTLAGFRKDIRMNIRCYEHEVPVTDLVSAGVLKAADEHITKEGKTYFFNGHESLECNMINVLRAKPELFQNDIVRGNDFWHVYKSIPKSENEDINNMKFKAIVGNPPYQEMTIGHGAQATAVYPSFIEVARTISPDYISMITPSRWMNKMGIGINSNWVDSMLKSKSFIKIVDYLDATECFPGVEIKGGVNYFLYSNQHANKCEYILNQKGTTTSTSIDLDNPFGVVIRDAMALDVIEKVDKVEKGKLSEENFSSYVGPLHFFDNDEFLGSNWSDYSPFPSEEDNIKCYVNKQMDSNGYGWTNINCVPRNRASIPLHKVYMPQAGGSGNDKQVLGVPFYGEANSVCSFTYLCIGYDPKKHNLSKEQCLRIVSYIKTRFFRYMVSIKKKTHHTPRAVFQFVPLQDFTPSSDIDWSKSVAEIDKQLYRKYKLDEDEIAYIESLIKPME